MQKSQTIIRALSNIEQAFTISNEAFPLCVVCVLHLTSGPEIQKLAIALKQLQARHLLLQAGITEVKGRLSFQKLSPAPPLELKIEKRSDSDTWRSISEQALNTTFDKRGPLMKCWYLPSPEKGNCELIICFHHAIIDGVSARLILHELLSLAGGLPLPESLKLNAISKYPLAYRKGNLAKRLIPFFGRQMIDEWNYKRKGISLPIPENSKNAILSISLTPDLSRKLSVRIGREGLSLNSVLLAIIAQTVIKYRHMNKNARIARVISFADLRSSVIPPVSDQELGCCISMVRFSIPCAQDQSVFQFAANIRKSIFKASRWGEVFLMSRMSKYLIKLTLMLQNDRLGVAALSFIGKLDLEAQYGPIQLNNVKAYITNNQFGPELSAFGKVLFGSIALDFTYLTSEFSKEQAEQIVQEIKQTLENLANFS